MVSKLISLLVVLHACAAFVSAKADDSLNLITISSFKELREIKDWSGLYVLIAAEKGEVWVSEDGDEIAIKKGKNFILDGGVNPPTISGCSIEVKDSKRGVLRNLVVRPHSDESLIPLKIDDSKDIDVDHCSLSGAGTLVLVDKSAKVQFTNCLFFEGNGLTAQGSEGVRIDSSLFVNCNGGCPALSSDGKKGELEMKSSAVFGYGARGSEYVNAKDGAGKMRLRLSANLYVAADDSVDAIYIETVTNKNTLSLDLSDNENQDGFPVVPRLENDENLDVALQGKGSPVPSLQELVENVGATGRNNVDDENVRNLVRTIQKT